MKAPHSLDASADAPFADQVLLHLRSMYRLGAQVGLTRKFVQRADQALDEGSVEKAVDLLEDVNCHLADIGLAVGSTCRRSPECESHYQRSRELIALYHQAMKTKPSKSPPTAEGATPPVTAEEVPQVQEPDAPSIEPGPREVSLDLIDPNPLQPRTEFSMDSVIDLANSIRFTTLQNEPLVRPAPDGKRFLLISGERRLRAVKHLRESGDWGDTIRVKVCMVDDLTALLMTVDENHHRKDINPIEEAWAFAELYRLGWTQAQIGERYGGDQGTVSNKIRLLKLPDEVKAMIAQGKDAGGLSASHGVALLSLDTPAEQRSFAEEAVAEKLSKAALEARIAQHKAALEAQNAPQLPFAEEAPASPEAPPEAPAQVRDEGAHDATETAPEATEPANVPEAPEAGAGEAEPADEGPGAAGDAALPVAAATAPEPEAEAAPGAEAPEPAVLDAVEEGAQAAGDDEAQDDEADASEEASDGTDEASEDQAAEPGPAEEPAAADGGAPAVVEPAAGAVSTPVSTPVSTSLSFTSTPKMLQVLIPGDLQEWMGSNAITAKSGLVAYARLYAFAEGHEWTPEGLLDALEGRDLPLLETLQARLTELAMAIHDAEPA